ncbi:hypothetical protein BDP81DRAFT_54173 [Colletotrichum phormii]|uniref:Secreted protein n=1 Tax=Colletotrichum phormii TaxID=359342 RepID=A0AAI9ZMV7_9PEZI|nr:uncharacterized protein BDP81DRAFT_54173 [Colletotrichum phormii]KAK1634879.1 hypothetical protein BDP81DRAFT_54173 [Colletotrichum phormii]
MIPWLRPAHALYVCLLIVMKRRLGARHFPASEDLLLREGSFVSNHRKRDRLHNHGKKNRVPKKELAVLEASKSYAFRRGTSCTGQPLYHYLSAWTLWLLDRIVVMPPSSLSTVPVTSWFG